MLPVCYLAGPRLTQHTLRCPLPLLACAVCSVPTRVSCKSCGLPTTFGAWLWYANRCGCGELSDWVGVPRGGGVFRLFVVGLLGNHDRLGGSAMRFTWCLIVATRNSRSRKHTPAHRSLTRRCTRVGPTSSSGTNRRHPNITRYRHPLLLVFLSSCFGVQTAVTSQYPRVAFNAAACTTTLISHL